MTDPTVSAALASQADTWFTVAETYPSQFYVLRVDRETLPQATVVSGPHATEDEAEAIAAEMRKVGTV